MPPFSSLDLLMTLQNHIVFMFINHHFHKIMYGHMDNKVRNQETGIVSFARDSLNDLSA